MVTAIFIIALLTICVLIIKGDALESEAWFVLFVAAIIAMFIAAIVAVCFVGPCVESKYIDDKIAMYKAENNAIEKDIETIVIQYQNHEKEVFDMSEIESPTTLVQMYPELKSDKLVAEQIKIFNDNNAKIKALKLKKINCEKAKFILYFGG